MGKVGFVASRCVKSTYNLNLLIIYKIDYTQAPSRWARSSFTRLGLIMTPRMTTKTVLFG